MHNYISLLDTSFCVLFELLYRGGQKQVYSCEYVKHRVYSCIIIYYYYIIFHTNKFKPTFTHHCISRKQGYEIIDFATLSLFLGKQEKKSLENSHSIRKGGLR